jgi:predicted HTH domain antitoxin
MLVVRDKVFWKKRSEMKGMVLEIPGELAEALRVPPEEQVARLRQELAVRLYQKGLLSFGKARELAGMTKWEFHFLLGEEGILRRYDVEELEEDLKTLEALG